MLIRVYYEDTDCGGIVYHANYMKYCERARSELFFSQGVPPYKDMCGFVLSAMEAKFVGFARLGDMLYVDTAITHIGRVQMLVEQHIAIIPPHLITHIDAYHATSFTQWRDMAHDFTSVFQARIRMGYVNVKTQKPAAIPNDFRILLQGYN